jgi:acetyltransferase-like isoleucine patch superfamily enzyme
MIHALTDIHSGAVIDDTAKVWAFTVIGDGVHIGKNSVIGTHCYIGKGTTIGKGVHIQTGVFLPNNSTIEDFAFIGPHVCFTDDRYPRSGNTAYFAEPPRVRMGASIGAGAVILPGVEIGAGAMIGAGAVVTKDVQLGDTAWGVPAKAKNGTASWRPEFPLARP